MEQYNSIQQILKKENGHDRKPIYPSTVIQAVFDAKTGASLEAILAQFNSIYVQYQGSPQATRNIIPVEMRRAGLTITYMNMDSETITEKASSAVQKDNDHWGLDVNWSRVDELSLSGDIAVSAQGTWVINGEDTKVKAIGPKGDTGLTPWLKTIDNKLHFSYDNTTWEPCSDYLASYFRFSATSSDSQAGTIGKIQISKDNKTWTDLSPEFRNYLRIQGYVATTSALPANQAVGTIYGVGPTYAETDTSHANPIYRLHVWNGSTWVDNGQFTSIAAGVVQETGDSETEVMSQKAVTEKLSELGSEVANLLSNIGGGYINVNIGEYYYNIDTKKINKRIGEDSSISISDDYYGSLWKYNGNRYVYTEDGLNILFDKNELRQVIPIVQGNKTNSSNGTFNTKVLKGDYYIAFCLTDNNGCVNKYALITSTGQDIEGKSEYYRFEPNKWYIKKISRSFVDAENWGCFVNEDNATSDGICYFKCFVNIEADFFEKINSCYSDKLYINQTIQQLNLIDLEQGSYSNTTGAAYDSNIRIRTKIIPVQGLRTISVSPNYYVLQAFYYKGETEDNYSRTVAIIANNYTIVPQDDETHVAFNFRKIDGDEKLSVDENIGLIFNETIYENVNIIYNELYSIIRPDFTLKGFWSIENGLYNASGAYNATIYIELIGVEEIVLNIRGQGSAAGIAFYDKAKNFISGMSTNYENVVVLNKESYPVGAAFFTLSKAIAEPYINGYAYYKKNNIEANKSTSKIFDRYTGRKMCTIGSSSTYPGEWQSHVAKWLDMNFSNEENQIGVGYVRIAGEDTYWEGLDYSESLPENATESTISASGTMISVWTDESGGMWRKAYQLSKGGDNIIASNTLNIFARAFDVKWYNPNVVFIMCYNEINSMTTEAPYGNLGSINDTPITKPTDKGSIYASYKGLIEYITKNIPMCEIVLVSTKLNTYEVYGDINSIMDDIRNSNRYKLDKIYHDAVKEIAEYYGVKFVDLFYNTGITPWSIVDYMQGLTDVHCNSKGQLEYIANNIYKQFMS